MMNNEQDKGPKDGLNDTQMAQNDTLNFGKPLNNNDENADPTPTPDPIPDDDEEEAPETIDWKQLEAAFDAGQIGYDRFYDLRLPDDDECISDEGKIIPRAEQIRERRRKRRRSLGELETLADVRKEMTRLYSDFHYQKIDSKHFTRSAYALNCIAQVIRMDARAAQDLVKRVNVMAK